LCVIKYYANCENIITVEIYTFIMGKILDLMIGNSDSLNRNDYENLDHRNTALNPEKTLQIQTATVSSKSDLLAIDSAVRSGDIILIKIGPLDAGLTNKFIIKSLVDTKNDVNGDIVKRSENEIIIAPQGVNISRKELNP